MDSLIVGVLNGLGLPAGLAGDGAPYPPSTPVEIGTSGAHHRVAEAGYWQVLIGMFAAVLVVGAAVLMYAVRQRTRVLERRRVRRMGEAAAMTAAMAEAGHVPDAHGNPRTHPAHATAHHTDHTKPPGPERVT